MGPLKQRSELWQFFQKSSDDMVTCNICSKMLRSSGNTSNMMSHMKHMHVQELGFLGEPQRRPISSDEDAVAVETVYDNDAVYIIDRSSAVVDAQQQQLQQQQQQPPEDQYTVFGKYITLELKNLQSDHLRKRMKRQIHQMILTVSQEDEARAQSAHATPPKQRKRNGSKPTSVIRPSEHHTSLSSYIQNETESHMPIAIKLTDNI